MIIGICGHGVVGASAVVDFLKGYSHIKMIEGVEFQLIHQPDGLCDLKYHLTRSKDRVAINTAINRFIRLKKTDLARRIRSKIGNKFDLLLDEYVESLNCILWKGKSSFDPIDISNISFSGVRRCYQRGINAALRKMNTQWHYPAFQTRYMTMMTPESFDSLTINFLQRLFEALGVGTDDDVLIDMLYSATNPRQGNEFFLNTKKIIIDRDPRDNFAGARRVSEANAFMPQKDVRTFVEYYRMLRECSEYDDSALYIGYEDMIYDYYHTTEKIIDYLGYTHRPENEFKYFNPNVSVKYTNFKSKLPQYIDEFTYIEAELKKYLYDFKEYIPLDINGYKEEG